MNYDDYKQARDLSWRVLLDTGTRDLPVKVSRICGTYGVTLRSYQAGAPLIRELGLDAQCDASDGFTVRSGGRCYVFYNMEQPPGRVRFTIAHELGHILLGHLGDGEHTVYNREPSPEDSPEEHTANVFASRLLAPACVLHALGAVTPEQIAAVCDISLAAARFRAGRMGVLEQRGKYGSSPLERRVLDQFQPYIDRVTGCQY